MTRINAYTRLSMESFPFRVHHIHRKKVIPLRCSKLSSKKGPSPMKRNTLLGAGVIILVGGYLVAQQLNTGARMTPVEVQKAVENDSTVVVLDVRTPAEFTGELGHIKGALLIPVQELEQRIGELDQYKKQRIITVCRSGHRSAQAAALLKANGFDVVDMAGGMSRWNADHLPVENDR
jgi:rhodanese-related sulfurtransferase